VEAQGSPSRALVVRDLGRRVVMFRADRTPPERVARLRDLEGLGDAVAAGEAEQLARDALQAEAAIEAARYREVMASQQSQWRRRKQEEFLALVHRVVNAESALNARTGDGPVEPRLVWHDLKKDDVYGWVNAQYFVGPSYLDLDLAAVLPSKPAGSDPRGDEELRHERAATGRELVDLITEWQASA
jgi:hypothetical protein